MRLPNLRYIAAALLFIPAAYACADDGAASIAAGGIVVLTREPRIVMAKEVLHIARDKVIVDYEFRNDTDADISTEVAFPIPPYDLATDEIAPAKQAFDDFRLWVDGKPIRCEVQVRAFVNSKDVTSQLNVAQVDISSFGHATSFDNSPDIRRLTSGQRKELRRGGLIDSTNDSPLWQVQKKYHWRQTFPAHRTVHIRHSYTPVVGATNSIRGSLGPSPDRASTNELRQFCLDKRLEANLRTIAESKDKDAPYSYVDFILTSANTWKTPIEDFTLLVDRPDDKSALASYISFCWAGPVLKLDADHYSAHASDFVPKRELKIGFFTIEKTSF